MTKIVNIFLGLIKVQIYKLKLTKIRAYKYVFKLRKTKLRNYIFKQKSNISTGRTVPKKPTWSTTMIQVQDKAKGKKITFKLKNLNTSLMMKNEILSLTCRMKILFFTWPLQVSLTFPDLSEKDSFPPDFPWPYKPCVIFVEIDPHFPLKKKLVWSPCCLLCAIK